MIDSFKNFVTTITGGSKARLGVFIVVALLVLGFLVFSLISTLGRSQEQQAPEFIPLEGPAVLLNSEALYSEVNNTASFDLLRVDIKYYARQLVVSYKDGSKEVIFEVKDQTITDREITVRGEYEEASGEVTIRSVRKNHGMLETTIESPFGSSATIQLPSQSDKNKFIGSLPQETPLFNVDYLERSDTFYVTFSNTVDNAAIVSAREYLQKNLNDQDLLNYNISAVGFTASGGVSSVQIVPKPTE